MTPTSYDIETCSHGQRNGSFHCLSLHTLGTLLGIRCLSFAEVSSQPSIHWLFLSDSVMGNPSLWLTSRLSPEVQGCEWIVDMHSKMRSVFYWLNYDLPASRWFNSPPPFQFPTPPEQRGLKGEVLQYAVTPFLSHTHTHTLSKNSHSVAPPARQTETSILTYIHVRVNRPEV